MAHVTSRRAVGTDLEAALRFVDGRIRLVVASFRDELVGRARDPFRGLYVSDADVDALLADECVPWSVESTLGALVDGDNRLSRLADRYALDAFDRQALLICLAPELDARYERLYGYLHDDVTRRRPSVELIVRLLTNGFEERVAALRRFQPGSALLRNQLVEFADEPGVAPLLSRPLRVDERVVAYLIGTVDDRPAERAIATPRLEGLAWRIEPRYTWDDIVLARDSGAQLRELCSRARFGDVVLGEWGFGRKHARRSGLTALFVGPPGTGKTMAAEVVASELGLDLFRIDLAAIVSKYIGETEKNLERIFRAADRGDAVLLFDEADALFGKRSETRDAHDRYANVEIAYLLQRLETYEGLALLTTNLRGNVDEAFLRRLDFVVEFPLPEETERLAIWRHALPAEAPLAEDVDLPFLARRFRLTGGHIRNVALAAGFLAAAEGEPISMKHLVRATRREHQKLGKMIGESDFERYGELLNGG